MKRTITGLKAGEILDSRGWPTVKVTVRLEGGTVASASVPSGASTGQFEAHELRDGDSARYAGRGVLKAVENIEREIAPALIGIDAVRQPEIDRLMCELDGTENKARLGANAILGVSLAVARASAQSMEMPLYQYLGGSTARRLPVPMMNIINGGKHAANGLQMQEFMIVPHGAPTYSEALRFGSETYHALKGLLEQDGFATGVGDEGGFAPRLKNEREALELIVRAIEKAGYEPGRQIAIALDPAATSFFGDDGYALPGLGPSSISSDDLLAVYADWITAFPIVSIEDGFAESDWSAFAKQTAAVGDRIQIVGDDLYVTNPRFIRRGIDEKATNAVLIKPNQIGTVTETVAAIELCRRAGLRYKFSHRSGETEDDFVADFAVAMTGGQFKGGAPCRGERLAKYNRLLEIERELGAEALFSSPFVA
ncbi:phosphopyruvate hydratase [Novosphingobium pentaromativorans]|uniref:Enolase n=1 Tax=Novosphingobium pentaromativorans US6-1 TaxID=1088721 RepID=G6EFB7_9SPHN|nr:phosphopyruvate hydratase [Novosphingobium pentaromativorans]AIT79165.1 enolase [Novosphingobium pentaromativorans US6-1]EHJ59962.1 Enolase [Novosphingobium pentaromativorans US6-1]